MNILKKIQEHARLFPQRTAVRSGYGKLSYGELWAYSELLTEWLLLNDPESHTPVAVYGHKHPWMLVCFLACVKAGRAYCPIDVSVPDARVEAILSALPSRIVLSTEPLNAKTGGKQVFDLPVLQHILQDCKITRTPEFISEKKLGTR